MSICIGLITEAQATTDSKQSRLISSMKTIWKWRQSLYSKRTLSFDLSNFFTFKITLYVHITLYILQWPVNKRNKILTWRYIIRSALLFFPPEPNKIHILWEKVFILFYEVKSVVFTQVHWNRFQSLEKQVVTRTFLLAAGAGTCL